MTLLSPFRLRVRDRSLAFTRTRASRKCQCVAWYRRIRFSVIPCGSGTSARQVRQVRQVRETQRNDTFLTKKSGRLLFFAFLSPSIDYPSSPMSTVSRDEPRNYSARVKVKKLAAACNRARAAAIADPASAQNVTGRIRGDRQFHCCVRHSRTDRPTQITRHTERVNACV